MTAKKRRSEADTTLAGLHQLLRDVFFRRRRFYYHIFPLISALAGCVFVCFVALFLLFSSPVVHRDHLHLTLFHGRTSESGKRFERDVWVTDQSSFFYGCSNASNKFTPAAEKTDPDRYLLITTSGGLNQQRTGITDAVVAAYILNATLVVPKLDQNSFWKDSSNFAEIFDVDWFIKFLSKDVQIVKNLPTKVGKTLTPHSMRVPRKCDPECYETHVLPVLKKKHAVRLGKFDYRLSNKLTTDLQKLRCRVNYHALKFTDEINEMGKILIERMRMKSKHFIALHLRFEPDMLAFSGCYYGGGEAEREELGEIRKRWKSLHASNPDKERRQGRCPLTPEEVALMLRGLGFESDVHLYVASGEVYGGEKTLAPLKAMFPNFHTKETLASQEELAPFSSFSSRMAALDFIVCDESNVFVTNNNGNMAKILAGRRRYFGHKPTIRPNTKKLYRLFADQHNMTWQQFSSKVQSYQVGFMGEPNEVKPGRGEFHENPSACICEDSNSNGGRKPSLVNQIHHNHTDVKENNNGYKETNNLKNEQTATEDDQEWSGLEFLEIGGDVGEKRLGSLADSDLGVQAKPEGPELEELFSD
ncbi:protein ROOT HAIR SPECIFIC 17-like isoform X2 [Benincasa hispida]|uniref:protein ROOT HAIR SPECIFIC 17-like isoform X2 n=1 Tax=Benincasa hispida TaxID=102211 RepID=UPI0019009021|nr:protein ROOT HAIR SPECIFIC 17-like isoform X2 [Benincasa hispida]